ncbi:MAG: GNAT family N-acetyltransferase [Bacilli bacterium]|nr:GNAT family N-acetyltransferase [Bacilli bacterium]MDD3121362.1 GNAT family N-acetyltransferase [Bacilli bacterium]MDD4063616.1 GNAT family N-acetyltransferase [Bacilli bacterium]
MNDLSFGKRLRDLRISLNLSQKQIADKLAISRQSVSKWEQGISLPQINYLVPLIKTLNCNIEDLFMINDGRKNGNLMINENFKVTPCKYLHGNLYEGIKKLYNSDKYFEYKVREVNYCNNDAFFIVGIFNNNVIGSCFVIRHEDNPNYFLISDFLVQQEYRNKGYGSRLIDNVITILEDHNAYKISAFISNDISEKVFTNFGFKKDKSIKNFGRVIPSSDDDVYCELKLNADISLEEITKENARLVGLIMNRYTKKYSKEIPGLLRPSMVMWRNHIMNLNFYNELALVICCGKIVIGYTYMYYVDYDDKHYVFFHIVLDENHLYEEAVSICIEKAKVFLNDNKQNHKLEEIRFYLNDSSIIMEHASFYRKALLNNGFISDDNEMYYLK